MNRCVSSMNSVTLRTNTASHSHFEFLGQTDCTVQTLDLAHEIVRTANRNNLGLVIDSFHFYAGGSTIDMIEALDPRLLAVFHINDAEDRPREELNDSHRLLPGLGNSSSTRNDRSVRSDWL